MDCLIFHCALTQIESGYSCPMWYRHLMKNGSQLQQIMYWQVTINGLRNILASQMITIKENVMKLEIIWTPIQLIITSQHNEKYNKSYYAILPHKLCRSATQTDISHTFLSLHDKYFFIFLHIYTGTDVEFMQKLMELMDFIFYGYECSILFALKQYTYGTYRILSLTESTIKIGLRVIMAIYVQI